MSTTLLKGHVVIQTDGYNSIEDYTKQSILTSSKTQSLFTVTESGHLELLGLHFDNLNPSSNDPLISISTDSDFPPQLQIEDCEFESATPDSQIYHSIISINGGLMKMERTTIENYKFMNGNSLIYIKPDQTSTVTISQTTFTSIAQTGAGNGAAINAQLQQDSILKVTDSCTFYNCSTQQSYLCIGGAINARVDGSNSQFIVSELVKFENCQSRQGGAISVELLNLGTCVINNVQFKECTVNNDGGGIFAQIPETGGTLTITNHTSFVQCINTDWEGGGMNIGIIGSNSRCLISDNVLFEKCQAERGGAIYINQDEGAKFEIHNVTFKECEAGFGGAILLNPNNGASFDANNVIFEKCEAHMGGAIYFTQAFGASFDVHNVQFTECISDDFGGALYYQLDSQRGLFSCILDGASFIDCSSQQYGGSMYIVEYSGTATINGSTFSSSESISNGGAIYALLSESELIIENTQFKNCYSITSDGGSIYAFLNEGYLSLNQVKFNGSSCTQPGSGGAIAIVQYSSISRISITDSSFTNCLTLSGGSSTQYGWGGAIYIDIYYNPPTLTAANFNLTDLTFSDCTAIENIGNNLHILSDDTATVGNQIKTGSLLTVKDLSNPPYIISDLYTSLQYAYDYMGINYSKIGYGYTQFTDHEPLFEQFFISNVPNPSYIDASNGKDIKFCGGQSSKCKTIKYSTERNPTPLSGIKPADSSYSIILTSNTALDYNIQIMSTTLLKGHVVIQTDGYNSIEDYTKQSILTSSKTQSLFTVTESGHLELLGLHFDNLNPSSNDPLISISTDSDFPPQLQIEDCEFESATPDSQIYHSIISINGGLMKMERTTIENYKLMDQNSLINIKPDQASTVTISQTSFISLEQQGTGNGAVINAQLNGESKLTIKDGCSFSGCQSIGSGGAIFATLNSDITDSGGIFIEGTTLTTFSQCSASQLGGAIYLDISIGAEDKFDLAGASYLTNNYAQYGNNLFINAKDSLRSAAPVNQGSKLGAREDSYEKLNLNNLMGYDGIDKSLAIPLYYVYIVPEQYIYHIKNPSDSESFVNGSGDDNVGCGHYQWPCLTIGYGITQSSLTSPPYQIGIRSRYKLNKQLILGISEQTIKIQNQLSNDEEISSDNSILLIENQGKLSITAGSISFDKITFSINENASSGYMIEGITESANININNCQMKMAVDSEGYSISAGLIELRSGNLIVNNLEVKDIMISDRSVINIKQGAEEVFILNCNFRNILKIGSIGGIIELSKNIDTSNEEQKINVRIETSSFIQPISTSSSNIATSSPFIHASIGKLKIISCSFGSEDESSDLGAHAISVEAECSRLIISNTNFTKLLSGGIQLEAGQGSQASIESCQFTNCGDGSQIAGAVYAVGLPGDNLGSVSITDSQFISCQGQQAGGIAFGDNIIPFNVKNNYFSKNSITDEKGAKDIYFLSKEMLDKAGGIEVIAEKYKYDKTDGYVGEVKISGFDANFAQYLDCKSEGKEDCGVIPCGGTKEQTSESCKETIKEEEIKGKKSKLSGGAIAGIVIGVVVGIVAIVVVIIVIVIYKKV
ncbi:MAG: hypothetical protein EZS28_016848 [Streblomastix strix]|uniref:Right handed beta helix domain-containing protein n=1 Tax=Streblomastix strix TaxID=222440 RepID=A0A5J4VYF1_9EUKA|nr:MAG: hypothetical protein EZS28_016848 [Streblomastix strix]